MDNALFAPSNLLPTVWSDRQKLGAAPITSNSLKPVQSDGQEQIIYKLFWCERTIRHCCVDQQLLTFPIVLVFLNPLDSDESIAALTPDPPFLPDGKQPVLFQFCPLWCSSKKIMCMKGSGDSFIWLAIPTIATFSIQYHLLSFKIQ